MLNLKTLAIALCASTMTSCAAIPLNLSEYTPVGVEKKIHSQYTIVNSVTADEMKRSGNPYSEKIQVTKATEPAFPTQLHSDLSRLFEQKFADTGSDRMVTVRIDEAAIFHKQNPLEATLLGLATIGRKRTVVAEAKLFLEFEEDGLVQRSTTFEHSSEIQHSIATTADMSAAISQVIQKFRAEALPLLTADVLDRYSWPD